MAVPIYVVDAFTDRPFEGNPAAVCLLNQPKESAWMQAVAGEMNLSETAFPVAEGSVWRLRWFTPKAEVDLCGHATLASAHVLWETGTIPQDQPAIFETRSGRLTCTRNGRWIEMDFPAEPPSDSGDPGNLLTALGCSGLIVGHKRNRMDYLVELQSEQAVRGLSPNMGTLEKLPVRGIIVTARSSDQRIDFVSRFFAPAVGVPEDPVTGSAHCCLGPYWGVKLGKKDSRRAADLSKTVFLRQFSDRRGIHDATGDAALHHQVTWWKLVSGHGHIPFCARSANERLSMSHCQWCHPAPPSGRSGEQSTAIGHDSQC